jgi:hypothetical protein
VWALVTSRDVLTEELGALRRVESVGYALPLSGRARVAERFQFVSA